jgi:hypothetical protein
MTRVADAPKDETSFPEFTPDLAAAMQQELDAFIDERLSAGDGTLASLLSGTSSTVPPMLAPVYGEHLSAAGVDAARRRGILSLPGVLAYHSADQHSGPIERGLLVRTQLLCQPVPAPPQAVLDQITANPINVSDTAKTTRQKYEMHLTTATCAGCHAFFDPIGFGMEEMDGMGRHRTSENGVAVDTTGELTGTDVDGPFAGVAELSDKLSQSNVVQQCFVERFFRFASSRGAEASEQCWIDAYGESFKTGGGRVKDLFINYVTDPRFAQRNDDRPL